jgi:hypothetical protein
VRTRFRFHAQSAPVGTTLSPPDGITTLRFNGWLEGRKVRPGRYRLVATPPGARPMRVRFRMLKVHP